MTAVHLLGKPAAPAFAQVSLPPRHDREPLIHAWEGVQKRLDKRGIQLGIRYDGELFADASGGRRRGAAYLGNMNLQLNVDARRLVGWPGATVFLYGLGVHGGHPSRLTGDAQGVSNIEAPAKWTLEEGWIQQDLLGQRFSVLIGRYDLNSEFYRLQSASLLLNSSFGVGPEFAQSGHGGPSIFPNTSVGAVLEVKPRPELVVRTAVLDGVPVDRPGGAKAIFAKGDGLLLVGEAAYLYRPLPKRQPRTRGFRIGRGCCSAYRGKVALGAWHYSAAFEDLTRVRPDGQPVRRRGSHGLYVLADQTAYQDADDPQRRLSLFAQLGVGDSRVNQFAYYTGAGLTFSALIPGRDQDEFGIGVAAAHSGSPFIEAQRKRGVALEKSEAALEVTYLARFGSRLAVQPDLQFVINPGTDPAIRNAVGFTLRFELSL